MSRPELEQQLRTALAEEAFAVAVSGDAWQQNQRRLARQQPHGRAWLVAAAAAVVVLVVLVGGGALLGGGGAGEPDLPARNGLPSGADDPFAEQNILGPVVEAETGPVDGERAVHEIVLSDTTGDGPQLCDRYLAASQASGGCAPRLDSADKDGVAFDWLAKTEPFGELRGLVAGVDERVARVRIWLADGEYLSGRLHPTGWEGTRMLTISFDRADPRAQRLVAYDDTGRVLQAVDLPARFGEGWLEPHYACAGDRVAEHIPFGDVFPNAYVALGTGDARITAKLSPTDEANGCIEAFTASPLAGVFSAGNILVGVVAPEVDSYRVEGGPGGLEADLHSVTGSPWQVLVVTVPAGATIADAQLVLLDQAEHEIEREYLDQPATP